MVGRGTGSSSYKFTSRLTKALMNFSVFLVVDVLKDFIYMKSML